MNNTISGGDQDLSVDEISLAPTEDLGTPIEDSVHDAQSNPSPSWDAHRRGGAIEEDEHSSEQEAGSPSRDPRGRYRRRSRRITEFSQSPLENKAPVNLVPDVTDVSGGAGGNNIRAADLYRAQAAPSAAVPRISAALKEQMEWEVTPIGPPIPASSTPFGNDPKAPHLTFYRSMSVLRDENDPEYVEDGTARVTHSVGDTVLIGWERNDPKENQSGKDEAVCRILAIFIDKRDGIARFAPQWGRSWSDILNPYSDEGTAEPDDELRGSKEIFWEAVTGIWPDIESHPLVERGLCDGELNEVHNISRQCIVRHRDEFGTEEELEEYLAEPDTYLYRYSLPYAGPLRFEELMCRTNSDEGADSLPKKKWLSGQELRMVDAFCGSGAVSVAATDVGWTVTIGVESNLQAFYTYAKNAPLAAKKNYKIQEFLNLVKTGTDPNIPAKGQVDYLHLSPPCQSLCSQNAHKGVDRYTQELIPLLQCIRDLIMELEPVFITIEEVPRFVYAVMPKFQYTKRKKAKAAEAAAAEILDAANVDTINEDEEIEVEIDNAEEVEEAPGADGKQRLGVRAWLHIVPDLLTSDWQVDMRVLNSAHYGCPQERPRLFLFAARRGYQLPSPPEPMYHSKIRFAGFATDTNLATIREWDCMTVQSDETCLPAAVTSLEAIDDLPRLLEKKEKTRESGALESQHHDPRGQPGICEVYSPRTPNCISRYVQYIRQGASPIIFDHQRLYRTIGNPIKSDSPFGTIIGQDDKWSKSVHYAEWRALTVLERRRGQSFPDKMWLDGSVQDKMKIVGNAVPYLLARAVTASVMVAATGNPSSAPPLPNLKGWVDKSGNEVEGPVVETICAAHEVPGWAARKRRRRRIDDGNGNGTDNGAVLPEEEGKEEEKEEEELEDEGEDASDDEYPPEMEIQIHIDEERKLEEENERRKKRLEKRDALREKEQSRALTSSLPTPAGRTSPLPENFVQVKSFGRRKFHTPMKMQKIDTFYTSPAPNHETATAEGEAEAESAAAGGAAVDVALPEIEAAHEESADVIASKNEPAVPAALYYQQEQSDKASSGQSSDGIAVVVEGGDGGGGSGGGNGASGSGQGHCPLGKKSSVPPTREDDVIDLTMDTDDE